MSRYARRTDQNHTALAAELRARGYAVTDLAAVGKGCPDLLVSKNGRALLVEVKRDARAARGAKRGAAQQATLERQAEFRALHPGIVVVAVTADDVDAAMVHASAPAPC